jgi:hypothetical protein
LIFINETGVNLAMVRLYARALKGDRAYGARAEENRKNITLIGAIALAGFVGAMTIDGCTNGDVFRVFIEQVLVPNWTTQSVAKVMAKYESKPILDKVG